MSATRRFLRAVVDSPGIVFCVLLALTGCLAIFNATFHTPHPYYFVYRQLVWLGLGTVAMLGLSMLRPAMLRAATLPLTIGTLVLLYALLPLGETINGMRGWYKLDLPSLEPVFSPILIQPGELAKPVFILSLAYLLPLSGAALGPTWRQYLCYMALGCIWLLPIFMQPDFGTLTVYVMAFFIVYWVQGGRLQHLAVSALAAIVVAVVAIRLHPYVLTRFQGFANPAADPRGAGWHILQFQATLANGGLTGSGQPVWAQNYLPLGYSDSIFATLAESVGFLGLTPVLLLLAGWLLYTMRLSHRQDDRRQAAVVLGLGTMIAAQALLHISVTLGILPPTGITFPLLSYGGSSLLATMMSVGIILAHAKKAVPPI